ncbi:MAG: rRNA pseudouridine synthase [Coriobacteriia bacterium]|nr:MAG: rRNA pseudouridine synthase [Coriobacteriia bacterium]
MTDATPEQPFPMRLQKFLARAGVASRRGSEDLMTAGRVSVNGQVVTELGSKVDPKVDMVCVDGREVHLEDDSVYLMLYKPKGYLTTMDDPQGRPCVAQLVPRDLYPGLYPVGRLDKDTTGLLLFTTDGDMGQHLLHPKHHVDKTYQAHVDGVPDEVDLARLSGGIMLDDGLTAPARVRIVAKRPDGSSDIELVIHEGRKRQVKRMCSTVHHPVLDLHRSSFGPLELVDVEEGAWRLLRDDEVASLRETAGL